ncbi:MAG: hypothetical protein WA632_04870 [Gallionella sp.]
MKRSNDLSNPIRLSRAFQQPLKWRGVLPLALLLAACGGGGSGSAPASVAVPKAWGSAALIETNNAGNAADPQLASDPNGNALAVWSQSDGTHNNIVANRYIAGTGWGTAVPIESNNPDIALLPQIAFDASGNALAVWRQSDGTRENIWSNRYTAGAGWATAMLIVTNNAGNAFAPQYAIDVSGNALAVWHQFDGTRFSIWSNRYTIGTGWGTAELIETDTGGAFGPQIAVDASGNAMAIWEQFDGTSSNIRANRYE